VLSPAEAWPGEKPSLPEDGASWPAEAEEEAGPLPGDWSSRLG